MALGKSRIYDSPIADEAQCGDVRRKRVACWSMMLGDLAIRTVVRCPLIERRRVEAARIMHESTSYFRG